MYVITATFVWIVWLFYWSFIFMLKTWCILILHFYLFFINSKIFLPLIILIFQLYFQRYLFREMYLNLHKGIKSILLVATTDWLTEKMLGDCFFFFFLTSKEAGILFSMSIVFVTIIFTLISWQINMVYIQTYTNLQYMLIC